MKSLNYLRSKTHPAKKKKRGDSINKLTIKKKKNSMDAKVYVDSRLSTCIHELKKIKRQIRDLKKDVNNRLNSVQDINVGAAAPLLSMYVQELGKPNNRFRVNLKRSNNKHFNVTKQDLLQYIEDSRKQYFTLSYYQIKKLFKTDFNHHDGFIQQYNLDIITKKGNKRVKIDDVYGSNVPVIMKPEPTA